MLQLTMLGKNAKILGDDFLKKISMLFILFGMLFFVVACTSNKTNNEMESSDNNVTSKGSPNNLISYYETIKLENAIESSFNKKVFKKKGYPDGYDLTLSRAKKEVVLVIRPYSKKNFNYLKNDLQNNIEEVLKAKNYRDYKVKVLAYWNETNQTERQIQEEKIIQEVADEIKQVHKIDVLSGVGFSATDGRIIDIDLSFNLSDKEITNINEINTYYKEFIDLTEKKGLNVGDIPTYFHQDAKRNWRMKIIPSINQGLKEIKDLKVTSITILNYNDPIIINTSDRKSVV